MKFSLLPRIRALLPAQPSIWRIETQYLPIAISFQRLIRHVSVIGLVGNEVRTLHFIDGFNLGKSCQVFVIKDLIIHFSLGRGRDRQKDGKEEEERRKGRLERTVWSQHRADRAQLRPAAKTGKKEEMPERQQRERAEELGGWDCAPPSAPALCQRHWQHGMLLGQGCMACLCCPQKLGSSLGRCLTVQNNTGNCCALPWGWSICPACAEEGQSRTYADDTVRGANAGTRG